MFYTGHGFESSFGGNQKVASTFYLNPWKWKEVSEENAKPGDIIAYTHVLNEKGSGYHNHVEIVAREIKNGDFLVYNCGGDTSIKTSGTSEYPEAITSRYKRNKSTGANIKILRPSK